MTFWNLELILGFIGTMTGLASLVLYILQIKKDKPVVTISDEYMHLEWDALETRPPYFTADLHFNINNIGEKDTTIYKIVVSFGPIVTSIEEIIPLTRHSTIKTPGNDDNVDVICFLFPQRTESSDGIKEYFTKREKLHIMIHHTHGITEKEYMVPPQDDWDNQKIWTVKALHFNLTEE